MHTAAENLPVPLDPVIKTVDRTPKLAASSSDKAFDS